MTAQSGQSRSRALSEAWASIEKDQAFWAELFPEAFKRRFKLHALLNPSFRAAFAMRVASRGHITGRLSRGYLISRFGIDVSSGATFRGSLYLPHPVGIVIGRGAVIGNNVTIYQNVTVGGDRSGGYPELKSSVTVFPNAVLAGGIVVEKGSVIGATVLLARSTADGEVVRDARL